MGEGMIASVVTMYFMTGWGTWLEHSSYDDMRQCMAVEENIRQEVWYEKFNTICVAFYEDQSVADLSYGGKLK